MENWIRLLLSPLLLPPLMVPVCLPYMAKCWLLYINVFPSPSSTNWGDPRVIFLTCLLHTWTYTAPVTDQESTDRVKRWCLCLQMLRESLKSWFGFFCFCCFVFKKKGRQCKQTEEQKKILSLHHQGGGVRILHFQVLIYWILEVGGFSYHEIPYMILHGRKHETFQLCPCMLIFT